MTRRLRILPPSLSGGTDGGRIFIDIANAIVIKLFLLLPIYGKTAILRPPREARLGPSAHARYVAPV
jgi:hypothetical protein